MAAQIPDHLHLGCGLRAPAGWLNVDGSPQVALARRPWLKKFLVATGLLPQRQAQIPWSPTVMRLNLTRSLPFPANHFVAVYSSHLLEHLYYEHALALLKEIYRVSRSGAVCRAVVPDLHAVVLRYVQAKADEDPQAGMRMVEELMVHDKGPKRGLLGAYYRATAFHQHKWMYDAASLADLFAMAGFTSVRQATYLDSRIGRIAEVEDAGRILHGQGVAVEGMKR